MLCASATFRHMRLVVLLSVMALTCWPPTRANALCTTSFGVVPSPNVGGLDNGLYGVNALSPTNVWAAGFRSVNIGTGPVHLTLIEHFNGSSWNVVSSPNYANSTGDLFGLAARSATNIWSAGFAYDIATGFQGTLTEHFNGTSWGIVSSQNASPIANFLFGVAAIPGTADFWAVGYDQSFATGHYRTLIELWNGSSWKIVPSPNANSFDNQLYEVVAISASKLGQLARFSAHLSGRLHFTGTAQHGVLY